MSDYPAAAHHSWSTSPEHRSGNFEARSRPWAQDAGYGADDVVHGRRGGDHPSRCSRHAEQRDPKDRAGRSRGNREPMPLRTRERGRHHRSRDSVSSDEGRRSRASRTCWGDRIDHIDDSSSAGRPAPQMPVAPNAAYGAVDAYCTPGWGQTPGRLSGHPTVTVGVTSDSQLQPQLGSRSHATERPLDVDVERLNAHGRRTLRVYLDPFLMSFAPLNRDDHRPSSPCGDRAVLTWATLPANPLEGLPGLPRSQEVDKADYPFFCDVCQKGFYTRQRLEMHEEERHIKCEIPQCNFSCKKSKPWKMELHMETLHNRPEAQEMMLMDRETYIKRRRERYPTNDIVKAKVEEIFYKATRGEVLPDERRRWMRQHGVVIRKRPRTEASYIASLEMASASGKGGATAPLSKRSTDQSEVETKASNAAPSPAGSAPSAPLRQSQLPPKRPTVLVPLGPNGTLTRSQKVQLIRERYRDAAAVPRFYVCNRCGEKGVHWVNECPKLGDTAYDRHILWGEERQKPPKERKLPPAEGDETELALASAMPHKDAVLLAPQVDSASVAPLTTPPSAPRPVAGEEGDSSNSDPDGPPIEISAREDPGAADSHQSQAAPATNPGLKPHSGERGSAVVGGPVNRVSGPEALREVKGGVPADAPRRIRRLPPRPAPPSLYSKLVESEKDNDKGLLLQAIRFFVVNKFFQ